MKKASPYREKDNDSIIEIPSAEQLLRENIMSSIENMEGVSDISIKIVTNNIMSRENNNYKNISVSLKIYGVPCESGQQFNLDKHNQPDVLLDIIKRKANQVYNRARLIPNIPEFSGTECKKCGNVMKNYFKKITNYKNKDWEYLFRLCDCGYTSLEKCKDAR